MAINFNPQIRFTSEAPVKKDNTSQPATTSPVETPTPQQPAVTEKKTPVRNFASKIAYGWINLSEGVRGVVNGLLAGVISGTIVGAGDWIVSGAKKVSKGDIKFLDMFKHPTSALGKVGKYVAPVVAGFVFVTNMVMAKLNANKRTADVDHQLYTGHRESK